MADIFSANVYARCTAASFHIPVNDTAGHSQPQTDLPRTKQYDPLWPVVFVREWNLSKALPGPGVD